MIELAPELGWFGHFAKRVAFVGNATSALARIQQLWDGQVKIPSILEARDVPPPDTGEPPTKPTWKAQMESARNWENVYGLASDLLKVGIGVALNDPKLKLFSGFSISETSAVCAKIAASTLTLCKDVEAAWAEACHLRDIGKDTLPKITFEENE